MCVVNPLDFTKTASTRDLKEALVSFVYDKDFGLELDSVPIFLVFNGSDHYCSVKPLKKTFKDGTKELYQLLSKARTLSDNLAQCTENPLVKEVFKKASENSISSVYAVDKLMQSAHEEGPVPVPQKKMKYSELSDEEKKKKRRKTKSGNTSFDDNTCCCGVPKSSKEELKDHEKRRHPNKFFKCIIEDCPNRIETKVKSTLRKHVQNQHFNEYYHFCSYCDYGADEMYLIENHEGEKHKTGISIPCTKLGCTKMFHSTTSRDRHSKYCKEEKAFTCEECNKSFKRESNYKHHLAVHSGDFKLIECKVCLKKYQSKTSYDAHISGKRCYPTTEQEQQMIRAYQKSQQAEQTDEIGEDELNLLEKEVDDDDPSSSESDGADVAEGGEDSMEDVQHLTGS